MDAIPLADSSADFGYSLGVLHHIPDTQKGIIECVRKFKPGAPLLLYLYYAFDNRPWWFRILWRISDLSGSCCADSHSQLISRVRPNCSRHLLAAGASCRLLGKSWVNVAHFPLSAYRHRSFYAMRTDALDRFGTRLEKRFTRQQIEEMMQRAGLERVSFSDSIFWCAVGYRTRKVA